MFEFKMVGNGDQSAAGSPGTGGIDTETTLSLEMAIDEGLMDGARLHFGHAQCLWRDASSLLHCGLAGSLGLVLAFLYGFNAQGKDFDDFVSAGTLTADDLSVGPCGIFIMNNIAALFAAIKAGLVYVQAHTLDTLASPGGKVRGQFFLYPY